MTITKEQVMALADAYADGPHVEGYYGAHRAALLEAVEQLAGKSAVSEPATTHRIYPPEFLPRPSICTTPDAAWEHGCLTGWRTAQATPPAEAKPLTDEQIFTAVRPLYVTDESAFMGCIDDIATARAIEQAHGIVNIGAKE